MKIFVFLFCLIVVISALPAKNDDAVGIETDNLPIEEQFEDLVGAEQRYRGGFSGFGGGGRNYGRRRNDGSGGFLRSGRQEYHGYGPGK